MSRAQWSQARLPVRWGGLDLSSSRYELDMQAIHVSDLAYLVSRRQSLEHAKRLVLGYDEVCAAMEVPAIRHLFVALWTSEAHILQNPNKKLDQISMLQALYKAIHRDLIQSSPVAAQVRLRAAAARDSGLWLTATPSPTRDFLFSNAALIDVVNMRLGIEFFGVGETCGYCHQVMDLMDHHVMGCIRQDSKYGIHIMFRNDISRYVAMAGLQPILEPTGLLSDSPQLKPIDILITAPPSLKSNSRRRFSRLAVDLAVTSPFQNHLLAEAAEQEFVSVTKYADRKRQQGWHGICRGSSICKVPY